jgi:phage baseplate assembly protein W
MAQDFLGVGWKFPVQVDEQGRIALSRFEDDIRESIQIILATAPGERQMRPDFGSGIHGIVFAENNMITAGLASFQVEKALVRWEPRIELLRVTARPDGAERNRVLVEIDYRVIATNTVFNLVYPFYLTEGAGYLAESGGA